MKTLNPFDAPGSLPAERQRMRRERFKIVVWTIVGANLLLCLALLIQGCQREPAASGNPAGGAAETASADTNGPAAAQASPDTNAPVPPAFQTPERNVTVEAAVTNATPAPVNPAGKQYVVAKGDSFYKIARANRLPMQALAAANPGLDIAKLKVGQTLTLPVGAEPPAANAAPEPTHTSAKPTPSAGLYVVKAGDTLGRIARAHGTTVSALKAANGLTTDRIVVGHSLKLPETRVAGAAATQG